MATTNPVYQVLVSSGNQAILAAGSRINALLNGQLGVFNFHTGLSIDGTVPADAKDIFIAVGINRTSGGTAAMEDFNKSAGQVIQARNMRALTVKGTMPEVQKVVDLTGFSANCDTDYALKIEFRNQAIYGLNGYNQFTKTFNVRTGCCADPCAGDCGAGDCNELAIGLVTNINADPDALIVASYFGWKIIGTINTAPTADGNTVVTIGTTVYTVAVLDADTTAQAAQKIVDAINTQTSSPYKASLTGSTITVYPKTTATTNTATITVVGSGVTINAVTGATKTAVTDTDAFKAAYPGACLGIRLTGVAQARPAVVGGINLQYRKSGLDFNVSLVDGFACNGTLTDITPLQYMEGDGYDLNQLEYIAGGWNGKPGPYRQSNITGMPRGGIEYFAVPGSKYNQISLAYDQMSVGGWLEYLNNLETIIAIPCADTTTLTGLFTVLDLIFTQFGAMTNDVASMNCSNSRTGLLTPATDGIESLS